MVGGSVIESKNIISDNSGKTLRRLWCVDRRRPHDECAVYADPDEAWDVRAGDWLWWQAGKIYWTRHNGNGTTEFTERPLRKVGYSFDPRRG